MDTKVCARCSALLCECESQNVGAQSIDRLAVVDRASVGGGSFGMRIERPAGIGEESNIIYDLPPQPLPAALLYTRSSGVFGRERGLLFDIRLDQEGAFGMARTDGPLLVTASLNTYQYNGEPRDYPAAELRRAKTDLAALRGTTARQITCEDVERALKNVRTYELARIGMVPTTLAFGTQLDALQLGTHIVELDDGHAAAEIAVCENGAWSGNPRDRARFNVSIIRVIVRVPAA